jgi:hypothetical protein
MSYKQCRKFNLDNDDERLEYIELINDEEKQVYREQFTWDKKTDSIPYIMVWWQETEI